MVLSVNVLKGKWNEESRFDQEKDKTQFRDYDAACDRVKNFYKEQHGTHVEDVIAPNVYHFPLSMTEKQTVEFNIKARVEFNSKKRARMGVWEAMEMLNTLVDESDPDVSLSLPLVFGLMPIIDAALQTNLSQIEHLLQTAEAIRRDGKPEWMQVSL